MLILLTTCTILLLVCIYDIATKVSRWDCKYIEYLLKKANEFYQESLKAFDPNPEKLGDDLGEQVGGIVSSSVF